MQKRQLSIFVDESGDLGPYRAHSPYYILSLVFHDQSVPIQDNLQKLSDALMYEGYTEHAIHTAPLIRRESDYVDLALSKRKKLFSILYNFVRTSEIRYASFLFDKREIKGDRFALVAEMSRTIHRFLAEHAGYLESFDEWIVYYDNGQSEINLMLNAVFHTRPITVQFRRVLPAQYRLFQAADLLCTVRLLAEKRSAGSLSNSERQFFSAKELKSMFKTLVKKSLEA